MLRTRIIPCLLMENEGLVKTINFRNEVYIGDPINSVRIYNELEVDELVFLDIKASLNRKKPPFQMISQIASECFMPFSYGGGIRDLDDVKRLFDIGIEKITINSMAYESPEFINEIANIYGSQSIIVAIDVKMDLFKKNRIYTHNGTKKHKYAPVEYAKKIEQYGAGEILLNSIDNDGMMKGFNLDLISAVSGAVNIPVIALGGAGEINDIKQAKKAGASAIGLGSMAVYQNRNRGILINFPSQKELIDILEEV